MSVMTASALLNPHTWTGKIFNGDWVTPTGGEYPVIEPATLWRRGMEH